MMTIDLPENLERSIREAVHNGHFASLDEAMAEAASRVLQQLEQGPAESRRPAATAREVGPASQRRKRIWEVAEDIRRRVPAEEWAKLPVDGAEEHDHYIYGTPKRPPAR